MYIRHQSQVHPLIAFRRYISRHHSHTHSLTNSLPQVHLSPPQAVERPVDAEQVEGRVADERSLHGLERSHQSNGSRHHRRDEHTSTCKSCGVLCLLHVVIVAVTTIYYYLSTSESICGDILSMCHGPVQLHKYSIHYMYSPSRPPTPRPAVSSSSPDSAAMAEKRSGAPLPNARNVTPCTSASRNYTRTCINRNI